MSNEVPATLSGLANNDLLAFDFASKRWQNKTLGALGIMPTDPDLVAIAALTGTGIAVRTAADTWALRSLVQPAAGLTIANADGVAGNPTFALANDLAQLEALAGSGFAVRDSVGAMWLQRSLAVSGSGLGLVDGSGVGGNPTFTLDGDLQELANLIGTGIAVRTALDSWEQRQLVAPAAGLTITNPAGVAGDPTFVLANDLAALEALAGVGGFAARSAADTWVQRIMTGSASVSIANGDGIAGAPTFSVLPAGVDHGGLGGLADDDHPGHPWLAGRAGGQTLKGGTAAGDHLELYATADAWNQVDAGRIRLHDRVVFPDNYALDQTLTNFVALSLSGTYTVAAAASCGLIGFQFYPTRKYSTAQALLSNPAFYAAAVEQPTASGLSDALNVYAGFLSGPHLNPDISSGTHTFAASSYFSGFSSTPRATLANAGALTIENMAGYETNRGAAPATAIGAGVTVDEYTHYDGVSPGGSGTLTTERGVRLNVTKGGTLISFESLSAATMRHGGKVAIGFNTAPTAWGDKLAASGDIVDRLATVATNDDPTQDTYQARLATTDATPTTLLSVTLTASRTYAFEVHVIARRTGGAAGSADDGAYYFLHGGFKTTGGAAASITAVSQTRAEEDVAGYNAVLGVSGTAVVVTVTGVASTNITWHCTARVWYVGS